jgi:catechol 2,3-dioxygenase-like lactoylglutathione lyase family enzyme
MQPLAPHGAPRAGYVPPGLWVQAERIVRVSRVVSDLSRAESFYASALGFRVVSRGPVDPAVLHAFGIAHVGADEVLMRIGQEEIGLVQFVALGRPYPADSRSADLWFRHLAIVVTDMEAAYAHLRSNNQWQPISSGGPQTLPPSGGGVRAFKFRDPDGHPLELLWLPPGHGRAVWHELQPPAAGTLPFIGIDHTALAVSSTRRSLAFYRSLGMRPCDRSVNVGSAQSDLDGLRSARVKVTGLRPASNEGPGLKLLAYRPPGRPTESASVIDLSSDWVALAAVTATVEPTRAGEPRAITDPDGHRFVLMETRAQKG